MLQAVDKIFFWNKILRWLKSRLIFCFCVSTIVHIDLGFTIITLNNLFTKIQLLCHPPIIHKSIKVHIYLYLYVSYLYELRKRSQIKFHTLSLFLCCIILRHIRNRIFSHIWYSQPCQIHSFSYLQGNFIFSYLKYLTFWECINKHYLKQ